MDATEITRPSTRSFAELDLLLAEEAERRARRSPPSRRRRREPDTVDAFNAQILAGLVSP